MAGPPETLDATLARRVLAGLGLLGADEAVAVTPLGGGVSSRTFLCESARGRWVLKQPQERFAVADDWRVDTRRAFVEYAFARALPSHLPPGALARAVTFLPHVRLLVFEAAPATYRPWKERLLGGVVEPRLGERAGKLLAAIHRAGSSADLAGRFRHPDLFEQQRIEPYFRAAARRLPLLAPRLNELIRRVTERDDLVHGDFSPKNLLTDGDHLVLVDHEVATRGDAAFDVAFLLTHLLLKAIHRPELRPALVDTGRRFLEAYNRGWKEAGAARERAFVFLGGLLLGRAVGKSPAEYLTPAEAGAVRSLGQTLLHHPVESWNEVDGRLEATLGIQSGTRR